MTATSEPVAGGMAGGWTGAVTLLLTVLVLSGCAASFRGEPARSFDEQRDVLKQGVDTILGDTDQLRSALTTADKGLRDRVILARMAEIDRLYADYETRLHRELRESGFATTLLKLAVDGAGAAASGGTSKVLSAISGGITGTSEAFSKDILVDRTVQALITQMRANRLRAEADIRTRMQRKGPAEYPLVDALGDLVEYRQAGTLTGAIVGIARNASDDEQAAQAALSSTFVKDVAGDALRRFWKPDGRRIDPDNAARIRQWMSANGLANESLTFFMRAEVHADGRREAARALGLTP